MNNIRKYIIKKTTSFSEHQKANKKPTKLKDSTITSANAVNDSSDDENEDKYTNSQVIHIEDQDANLFLQEVGNKIAKYQDEVQSLQSETIRRQKLTSLLDEIFELSDQTTLKDKNHMFKHLHEMLEQVKSSNDICYQKKENLLKYVRVREKIISAIDIFSWSVFYYFLVNVTNSILYSRPAQLQSRMIFNSTLSRQ